MLLPELGAEEKKFLRSSFQSNVDSEKPSTGTDEECQKQIMHKLGYIGIKEQNKQRLLCNDTFCRVSGRLKKTWHSSKPKCFV